VPGSPAAANGLLRRSLALGALGLAIGACGRGATDSTPPLPLTTVTRLDLGLAADSVLVGDSVSAAVRGFNREGTVLSLSVVVWSTTDTSIGAVSPTGLFRARNVGSVRLEVLGDGVVAVRTVRVVPRALRLRVFAPDTAQLIDDVQLTSDVATAAGVPLPEVAPRFVSTDTAVATLVPVSIGRARVVTRLPGAAELLAIVGRDTARRRFVVTLTPLRSLRVMIESRTVAVGDSVPFVLTAIDSLGRTIPSGGTAYGLEPTGTMTLRNGHLVALAPGRVVVRAQNGATSARDTLVGQLPSEFPLDIVDGDGQRPLLLRVLLSMERVANRWRRVIRSAPPGDAVRLQIGECRNAVPVSQFISGVRVLLKLDSLPSRIAGQGGPCVVRSNGLPLLGTVSLNLLTYNALSDRKLDDLIQHEVGHVLGLGTIWGRAAFSGLVLGDTGSADPIFVGPAALSAFSRLGRSGRFTGRPVPIQLRVLGHWRSDAFGGEVMAPSLIAAAQPTSSVSVAALRDLGWTVETEAYDDYELPDAVLSPGVSPRVQSAQPLADQSLSGDVLLPQLMIRADGRKVRLNTLGRPVAR